MSGVKEREVKPAVTTKQLTDWAAHNNDRTAVCVKPGKCRRRNSNGRMVS